MIYYCFYDDSLLQSQRFEYEDLLKVHESKHVLLHEIVVIELQVLYVVVKIDFVCVKAHFEAVWVANWNACVY